MGPPELTRKAERAALSVFEDAAAAVPAYGAYLRERGVDAAGVRTIAAFRQLPLATREAYVQKYPVAARCREGSLGNADFVAVSSGSSGEPTFWPRAAADEAKSVKAFERVFREAFGADRRATLAVVCFPLGTWVGGMFTAGCCRELARRGQRVMTVTPGNNVAEILRVVQALGPGFEQTVLLGYPPFLKDVVDAGRAAGVPWERFSPKMVLAGEVFSEAWRTLMGERLGIDDPLRGSASLYGTADAGVLGAESAVSVALRRFLAEHVDAAEAMFGKRRLPTLVQYDPRDRYFETHEDGTLVLTTAGAMPLVRYHIADEGGVIAYGELVERVRSLGFDAERACEHAGVRPAAAAAPQAVEEQQLPFVFVFGRSRFAISFYGANVFPETVSLGLEREALRARVTGKFVMEVREETDRDRSLAIAVELATGEAPDDGLRDLAAAAILEELLRHNSEFAHYVPRHRQPPLVSLWPKAHPEYFPAGVKHRYSR